MHTQLYLKNGFFKFLVFLLRIIAIFKSVNTLDAKTFRVVLSGFLIDV